MKFPWMDSRVAKLTAEIAEIQEQLREYRRAAVREARAGDEARAEARQLRVLLIECEAARIGQGLQRHDDQKQMDELVALGIQQDKDEIANLKAEKEVFEEGCRKLAYQLSSGGYNAAELTAEQLIAKVQGGLDLFCESTSGLVQKVEAERDQLKAENAELLRDAERYRLAKEILCDDPIFLGLRPADEDDTMDSALDAEMARRLQP